MAHTRARKRRPMSQINVVPYIDVMLVLLVIFMITAPVLQQAVEVDLPREPAEVVEADTEGGPPLVVEVTADGAYLIIDAAGKRSVAEDALGAEVEAARASDPEVPVYVAGARDVDYGRVVRVLVALQTQGIRGVGLLTAPLSDAEGPR